MSPHILHKKNCRDLNLSESLCIFTFFLFPDSALFLRNDFFILIYFKCPNDVAAVFCDVLAYFLS